MKDRVHLAGGYLLLFLFIVCLPSNATLIPPQFLDRVVVIGRGDVVQTKGSSELKWTPEASGFFYGEFVCKKTETANTYAIFLVTNRHVIEGHSEATNNAPLWVRMNLKSEGFSKQYPVPLKDTQGAPTWHMHPNPNVDIAIVAINVDFLKSEGARFDYFRSDLDALSRNHAKEIGLSEGDGVYVLGFPMGLISSEQYYVIVRQGVIARVRDYLDSPSVTSFLIDAFVFPGSSGGPVALKPELVSIEGSKPAIERAYLLGVAKGYLPYSDVAYSAQTQHPRISFEENSGLAEVIPIEYVDETIQDLWKSNGTPTCPVQSTADTPVKPR
ncbi:MAG TPA: serine protease [Terriglobales bacterium]|nr:serine protease [Terriglobales bacterium]